MANAGSSDGIKESSVEAKNIIDIEETCVTLNCVKNEPNEEGLDFEEDDYATQYTITLNYKNLFGIYRIINEDYDNLIGFNDNDVIMENAMIKLDALKEEYDWSFNDFYCSKCKGIYKGYCLKCSTLLHILNNNFGSSESQSNAIPRDILEIKTSKRGVYLLRTLPINVIFGPFEGILGIENTIGHSWKIIDNKLSNVEYGNWMKNIVCAPNASTKNLDIFQFDGNLYFQTNREIAKGEELLIYYDVEELRKMGNGEEYLYTPQKLQKLPKVFACTFCCFGFGSNKCLMEHKKKCCLMEYSKSTKDFVLVECHYCKMWMEKWEHEEYHVTYCLEKHHRMSRGYFEADMDVEEMEDDCDTNGEETQSFSGSNHDIGLMERSNNEVHNATETHNKDHFKNHLNKQRAIKRFHCDLCKMKFTRKMSLKSHMRNKHANNESAKDYKCTECSYQTAHKKFFKRHLKKHKGLLTCPICMIKFTLKGTMRRHMKNKHSANESEKDYKCSECPFQTNRKDSLNVHLNRHRDIFNEFECGICKMTFTQKSNLKSHMRNKHANDESGKDYKCTECSYQTNYKYNFQGHLNKHRGITPFTCHICMRKFTLKCIMDRHIKDKHSNEIEKDYKCSECPYQTNHQSYLKLHLNKHKGIKPFTCHICMMKFTQKNTMKRHIKDKHSNRIEKDYKCTECPFQTNQKSYLAIHLNKHKGIRPFECSICKMTFTRKSTLKLHIKNQHTGDGNAKDYECSECSFKTKYKHYFEDHLNSHTSIEQFQCAICMKKYTVKRSLKAHIKDKHADNGEKAYKCTECFYQTNIKNNFERHLNRHRSFECGVCKVKFEKKEQLKRHIKNKHADN